MFSHPERAFGRGVIATIILGILHLGGFLAFKLGWNDHDEGFSSLREAFFSGVFPLVLWCESILCVVKGQDEMVNKTQDPGH